MAKPEEGMTLCIRLIRSFEYRNIRVKRHAHLLIHWPGRAVSHSVWLWLVSLGTRLFARAESGTETSGSWGLSQSYMYSLIGPTLDRLLLQGALTVHRLDINLCNTLIPSLQGLLELVTSVLIKQLTRNYVYLQILVMRNIPGTMLVKEFTVQIDRGK